MGNLNELTGLMQQVSAVMDDINKDDYSVLSIQIDSSGEVHVHISDELFFEHFKGFKIEFGNQDYEYMKFRLSKLFQGVEFIAYAGDLNSIKKLKNIKRNGVKKGHKKAYAQCNAGKQINKIDYFNYR